MKAIGRASGMACEALELMGLWALGLQATESQTPMGRLPECLLTQVLLNEDGRALL